MAINPVKTTCMVMGTNFKIRNSQELQLYIDKSAIRNVTSQKLLGVYIDECLTWKLHVDKTCLKLVSKISLLKRIQNFLTPEMKQLFYNAYIASTFDYGCLTWGNTNKTYVNRINKLQKRAARIILHKPMRANSMEMFKNLQWLSFQSRCKYFTGIMVFKSLHLLAPTYMIDSINACISENKCYNLRSATRNEMKHKRSQTNYLKRTFMYSSIEIWNNIPINIRALTNIKTFKVNYKTHLLNIDEL